MRSTIFYKLTCCWMCLVMAGGSVPPALAQSPSRPSPAHMLAFSQPVKAPVIKGLRVYPDNPFRFDFILDQGDPSRLSVAPDDANRLIKYFLTALTVPDDDLWVNLSPYEKDRIIPASFGATEMGRDLLAQDHVLKQITASALYPDGDVGRKFWERLYRLAHEQFGTTDIPVDTFNKVWVVPEDVVVYENKGKAFIVQSRLKVMLESDYLAAEQASPTRGHVAPFVNVSPSTLPSELALDTQATQGTSPMSSTNEVISQELSKNIIRDIIIPEIEKEVNEGAHFVPLRQVYASLILATWFKRKLKQALLNQVYSDRNKVSGLEHGQKDAEQKIWKSYVALFNEGVFKLVREEEDPLSREVITRKYVSGGASLKIKEIGTAVSLPGVLGEAEFTRLTVDFAQRVDLDPNLSFVVLKRHLGFGRSHHPIEAEKRILKDIESALVVRNGVQVMKGINRLATHKDVRVATREFVTGHLQEITDLVTGRSAPKMVEDEQQKRNKLIDTETEKIIAMLARQDVDEKAVLEAVFAELDNIGGLFGQKVRADIQGLIEEDILSLQQTYLRRLARKPVKTLSEAMFKAVQLEPGVFGLDQEDVLVLRAYIDLITPGQPLAWRDLYERYASLRPRNLPTAILSEEQVLGRVKNHLEPLFDKVVDIRLRDLHWEAFHRAFPMLTDVKEAMVDAGKELRTFDQVIDFFAEHLDTDRVLIVNYFERSGFDGLQLLFPSSQEIVPDADSLLVSYADLVIQLSHDARQEPVNVAQHLKRIGFDYLKTMLTPERLGTMAKGMPRKSNYEGFIDRVWHLAVGVDGVWPANIKEYLGAAGFTAEVFVRIRQEGMVPLVLGARKVFMAAGSNYLLRDKLQANIDVVRRKLELHIDKPNKKRKHYGLSSVSYEDYVFSDGNDYLLLLLYEDLVLIVGLAPADVFHKKTDSRSYNPGAYAYLSDVVGRMKTHYKEASANEAPAQRQERERSNEDFLKANFEPVHVDASQAPEYGGIDLTARRLILSVKGADPRCRAGLENDVCFQFALPSDKAALLESEIQGLVPEIVETNSLGNLFAFFGQPSK